MRDQLELFFTALGFFTRLPVPAWVPWSSERMHHAARYFALVGWVVGGAGALGYLALAWLLPPAVAVVLSMALTIRLTGAFHEDGLADTCDGLGGGLDRDRALAIMKDSRIGSYGAIGLVLALLLKALALVNLGVDADMPVILALLAAHPLSRLAPVTLMKYHASQVMPPGPQSPLPSGQPAVVYAVFWLIQLPTYGAPAVKSPVKAVSTRLSLQDWSVDTV